MEEFFNVGFETDKKNEGHVLDSYIMLYLEPIAQLEEHLTFNQRVADSSSARFIINQFALEVQFLKQ